MDNVNKVAPSEDVVCGECMAQEQGHCRHVGSCKIRAALASERASVPTSWRCTRCGATYSHPGSFSLAEERAKREGWNDSDEELYQWAKSENRRVHPAPDATALRKE